MSTASNQPYFPDVKVNTFGTFGDPVATIILVQRAMRRAGIAGDKISEFFDEAVRGTYLDLIATCRRWVRFC